MSGDITPDEKQKWAMYFISILHSRGFTEAARSLEETYNPFPKESGSNENFNWSQVINERKQ